MAAFNLTALAGSGKVPYIPHGAFEVRETVLNCAEQPLTQAASDEARLITINAGETVLSVAVQVLTPEGETCVANVGDSASATQFLTGANMNATAGTMVGAAGSVGKFYAAADYIRLLPTTTSVNMNVARVRVSAVVGRIL